ncbi:MAG: cation:proton antiporter [Anaeromyxobacteraceae bacterium]
MLVSERARRTILSTSVLFLAAGVAFGLARGPLPDAAVHATAEAALVAVLFNDAMRASWSELRRGWRLPGRALLVGFPLTGLLTALAARALGGLPWPDAFLVGAALASTDPVFAAAVIGSEEVPGRIRHLLNVESGLNDGLALPFVVAFLALSSHEAFQGGALLAELSGGVALGVAVPWALVRLERSRVFGAADEYRPVGVLATGLLTWTLARALHANAYLAAFAAGATLVTVAPRARRTFSAVGDVLTEVAKLGALLVFATRLTPELVAGAGPGGWAFAAFALFVARPAALLVALHGTELTLKERLFAGWFGPRGFASVVYGLLVAGGGSPAAGRAFLLVALTTALSMLLHSSSDVVLVRWLRRSLGPAPA